MKNIKRVIAGSFLALSMLAAPAAMAQEETSREAAGTPVLVYCISCGTHHLINI